MTIAAGTRLGPYSILAPLGAGGMGEVYRARDERLGRDVAIKVLPEAVASDEERLRRFEQEARSASALNHPNIVTIHDVGRSGATSWIAMELVEGESLRHIVAGGPLPAKQALSIGTQIAEGLAKAHASNIVHRDLKPENVMVTSDGLVKILDFGLAKLAPTMADGSQVATAAPPTDAGVVMGTVGYMSPEQATGRSVDSRSDQFALGAILYEMATGRRAFQRASAAETLSAILREEPPGLASVSPGAPDGLDRIVRRCLAKEPEARYHSTRDLARDLEELRNGDSDRTAARPPAKGRSGRLVAAAILAFGLAIVGAFLVRGRWTGPSSIRSLAVLPLKSLAGDPADEALGLGIADTVIRGFSRSGAITVRPMSSVRRFAKSDVDALAAARELKADAVLEGSLQRAGGKLRVSLNMLRVRDGRSMWAESFDVPASEVFEVEDAVSDAVVSRLRLQLAPVQRDGLKKRDTDNAQAYEAFARGNALQARSGPGTGGEENRQAIGEYERAVALDNGYALARANLALAYLWRDLFFEPDAGYFEKAKVQLAEAERLDPHLAETHLVRYQMAWSYHQSFDLEAARRELLLAQQIDPGLGSNELSILYAHMGLNDAFSREIARAAAIDPTSELGRSFRIEGLVFVGRFRESIEAAERAGVPLSGNRVPMALLSLGRFDDARRAADALLKASPGQHYAVALRELVAVVSGERAANEEALKEAERSGRRLRDFHHTAYAIACLRAAQGDAAGAVAWLRRTVATGMPARTLFLMDPLLARVRGTPEFAAFDAELEPVWRGYERESATGSRPGT
jgi:TolB-like protein/tetratricopeptide (TPR) repeat protein